MKIADHLLDNIRRHGERTYPEEGCGVMFGSEEDGERVVASLRPIENSQDENRRRRFLITPQQYLEAEQYADRNALQLLGFYHSHPDHPAIPSQFDADHAMPWFTYVIVSVRNGRAEETTAWTLNEDRTGFTADTVDVEKAKFTKARA